MAVGLDRIRHIFLLTWTGALLAQKTDALSESTESINSPDTSYFFYQQSEFPRDCEEIHDQCSSNNSSGVFLIKPDGFPEPFEVFCDLAEDSAGWTVIQRRTTDGFVRFDREWIDYKNGFGFLSHEFWIGNERLAYLTNQKENQLLIQMTLTDGSILDVSYSTFRISDEFGGYTLLNVSEHSISKNPSWCPFNMVFGSCVCGYRSCGDSDTCHNSCTEGRSEGCVCPDGFYMERGECVPVQDCGCYVPEEGIVVLEGDTFVNSDCSRIAVCANGELTRNELYECIPNSACGVQEGQRGCYCNDGFTRDIPDGETCSSTTPPIDCMDVYSNRSQSSGVYSIKPTGWPGAPFDVYCNMTEGGGWTVLQKRFDGSVDFFREWSYYKSGFGDVSNEHWLGNDKIHFLTNQRRYEVRIDLVNRDHNQYYGAYDFFRIENEADLYRLSGLGTYSGNADGCGNGGYYLLTYYSGRPFSTKDRDNDAYSGYNIASGRKSAWWYNDYSYYTLNGEYSNYFSVGCLPGSDVLYSSEMKIRPV